MIRTALPLFWQKKLTVAWYMEMLPFLLENTDCDHGGKCIQEWAVCNSGGE